MMMILTLLWCLQLLPFFFLPVCWTEKDRSYRSLVVSGVPLIAPSDDVLTLNATTPNGRNCHHFTSNDEQLACLRIISVAASSEHNMVVLLMSTNGGRELLDNWIQSANAVGLINYVVVCLDAELYEAMKVHGPMHSVLLPHSIGYSEGTQAKKAISGYKSKEWSNMMMMVPKLNKWVLALGVSIVYCDTDIVLLRNPLSAFVDAFQRADFSAQVDGQVLQSDPLECSARYSSSAEWKEETRGQGKLCGGLFLLSPDSHKHNMDIIDTWIHELDKKERKNQPAFNRAIQKVHERHGINVQPLNCSLFPNGYRFNDLYAGSWWKKAQSVPPLLVHANWVKAGKKELMQSWDMWYGKV